MDKSPNLEDSKTTTAPMLATSEPAGSGMIPELVTAGRDRHDERDSSHVARVEREYQGVAAASAINFLRRSVRGSSCSIPEHKDMHLAYITQVAQHLRAVGGAS